MSNGKGTHRGLKWPRLFGGLLNEHPYDSIKWDVRTAKIVKGDGVVVFEQQNVEVPEFWSQTATDIVASKYFRGRMDAPERETSAKQMVDRVADTVSTWGWKDGYFATEEDFRNFNLDLKYLLINQYAAFNSPVWFNVGVHEVPQASACFILSVEDTMASILEWYETEGWIFKGGSGSGINLSPLRSSKDALSKGGHSSGPVSFMKGADGVANSIRSGGTTRRAAKMVVLNVDHPDIKDFIYCKKHIEDMTKILETSGIKASVEGELFNPYTLLPYQNANNSVRVTDDFMKAVESDGMWDLKSVTTGKTLETLKAREIMQWMADAAWHSADPGIQYDTTINDWHTCPNSGRINASNPCVTGDARIATSGGLIKIQDLVNKNPLIKTPSGYYKTSKVWQTGVRPVYKLTTKAGYSIKVTEDHKFYVDGKGDVAVKDLKSSDRLFLEGSGFGTKSLSSPLGLMIGYGVGDGCVSHKVTRGPSALTWVGGQDDINVLQVIADTVNHYSTNRFGNERLSVHVHASTPGLKVVTSRPDIVSLVSKYAVMDMGSVNKKFTDEIYTLDQKSISAVLQGLFTADGTVSGNQEKGYYVGLDSTSLELIEQVQLLLLNFDVKSKIYKNRRTKLTSYLPDSKRNPKLYDVQQMHSLRVTRSSRVIFEREIGFAVDSSKAHKLREINKNFFAYKDVFTDEFLSLVFCGVEPVYDLTEPMTHHFVANGLLVHNCSEYMHIDNSACNLASINLLKFLGADGVFDVELYKKAIDTMITAQDIIVDNSSYPTPKITQNAKDFRQLGLGYSNLGSLIMTMGLPYDSDEGRSLSACVSSILGGQSYLMSARLADIKEPFHGYEVNEEPMLGVIGKHLKASRIASRLADAYGDKIQPTLKSEAVAVWEEALRLGRQFGVRNSQVTVLAPTGTISFLMDCDTTGIEPELALVKYKKLVGGGTIKLVNNQVSNALRRLGYGEETIQNIIQYILQQETIEGAPGLDEKHLPIFDCSFKATNGTRSIHYTGHLKMMGAAQPFISGAISKTANLPAEATVEEMFDAFIMSWKLGLKAVAFYRDGSKSVQPLNVSDKDPKLVEKINGYTRIKMPDERPSVTHKFSVANYEGYLTVGLYPDTMQPGETFITTAKEGSTISGLFGTIATLTSLCLQSGIPLKTLVKKFKDVRFEPAGFTANEDVPVAKSVVDYIFRYLGNKFLSSADKEEIFGAPHVEIMTDEIQAQLTADISPPVAHVGHAGETGYIGEAPLCPECGSMTFRAGSCFTCPNCFATTGVCN